MRSELKKGRHMQVKKGRVLGLVIVGPLRSVGVGVSVVFYFSWNSFHFFPFLYISLFVGILFAVHFVAKISS